MSIKVPASSFSAFLGRHRYKSRSDTIKELYEKYESRTFEELNAPIPDIVESLVDRRKLTQEEIQMISDLEPTKILKDGIEHVVQPVHQLAIARGVVHEKVVLDDFNDWLIDSGSPYRAIPHMECYYLTVEGILLMGIFDGLLVDEDQNVVGVVEIKNRLRGFFGESKLMDYMYDIDQLMCYHKLLGGQSKIHMLVQCHNGSLKVTEYDKEFMDQRWDECLDELHDAIDDYIEYRHSVI